MEDMSLLKYLEAEKEMTLANLARDRSPEGAQVTLGKTVDRVLYRYTDECPDAQLREEAQVVLQTVKNALPMIDAVGETRQWKRDASLQRARRAPGPASLGFALGGLVLVLAAALAGQIGARMGLLSALLPCVLGAAALFWGGVLYGRPPKAKATDGEGDVRVEYLVDSEKLWHHLKTVIMLSDGCLDAASQASQARRQAEKVVPEAAAPVSRETLELLSGILEAAYARDDAEAREVVGSIRFYLHNAQVSVIDYEKGHEAWFERLPATRPGTIRPALVMGDKLLMKGLASA